MTIYQDYVGAGIQPPVTIQGNPITTDTLASDKASVTIRGSTTITKPNPDADVSPDNIATITGVSNPTITATSGAASNSQRIVADLYRLPGGVADEYDGQAGKLIKRVGKLVLDGTETFTGAMSWSNETFYTFSYWDGNFLSENRPALSTHFAPGKTDADFTTKPSVRTNQKAVSFSIDFTRLGVTSAVTLAEKVSAFKTYLAAQKAAGTPVTVYYELATPIITETRHDLRCYDGQTTIACADPLATDMAVTLLDGRMVGDAYRLGGLGPEYYRQSNPNILINGGFDIWQRGVSITTTAGQLYIADGWKVHFPGVTATQISTEHGKGIRLTRSTAGGEMRLIQILENRAELAGKPLTLTFWIRGYGGFSGNVGARIGNESLGFAISSAWDKVCLTTESASFSDGNEATKGVCLYAVSTNPPEAGAGFESAEVKLEYGAVATPYVPTDPATELAKCQRYQFVPSCSFPITTRNMDSNNIWALLPLPVTPRVAPSASSITEMLNNNKIFIKSEIGTAAHTGFTCTKVSNAGNGLEIQFTKTGHGISNTVDITILKGTVFDFGL